MTTRKRAQQILEKTLKGVNFLDRVDSLITLANSKRKNLAAEARALLEADLPQLFKLHKTQNIADLVAEAGIATRRTHEAIEGLQPHNDPVSHYWLAVLHAHRKDYVKAAEHAEKARNQHYANLLWKKAKLPQNVKRFPPTTLPAARTLPSAAKSSANKPETRTPSTHVTIEFPAVPRTRTPRVKVEKPAAGRLQMQEQQRTTEIALKAQRLALKRKEEETRVALRRDNVLAEAMKGKTVQQIAKELGITRWQTHVDLKALLESVDEPTRRKLQSMNAMKPKGTGKARRFRPDYARMAAIYGGPEADFQRACEYVPEFAPLDHERIVNHFKQVYGERNWPVMRAAVLKAPGLAFIGDHQENAERLAGMYDCEPQRVLDAIVQNHGFAYIERHDKILKYIKSLKRRIDVHTATQFVLDNARLFTGDPAYIKNEIAPLTGVPYLEKKRGGKRLI